MNNNDDPVGRELAFWGLVDSYFEAFGEQPDSVIGMVIASSVSRASTGEPYHWVQDGRCRKLVWGQI